MAASSHEPRPYHLTPAEESIMKVLWDNKKPLSQQQIIDATKENGDLFWKERSVFALINSLMRKGLIKEDGMVRAGKTYARTFAAAMSRPEFYAAMVTNALTKKELSEFRHAMRHLANEDAETSDEEL